MAHEGDSQLGELLHGQVHDRVHGVDAARVEVLQVPRHLDGVEPLLHGGEVGQVGRVRGQRVGGATIRGAGIRGRFRGVALGINGQVEIQKSSESLVLGR